MKYSRKWGDKWIRNTLLQVQHNWKTCKTASASTSKAIVEFTNYTNAVRFYFNFFGLAYRACNGISSSLVVLFSVTNFLQGIGFFEIGSRFETSFEYCAQWFKLYSKFAELDVVLHDYCWIISFWCWELPKNLPIGTLRLQCFEQRRTLGQQYLNFIIEDMFCNLTYNTCISHTRMSYDIQSNTSNRTWQKLVRTFFKSQHQDNIRVVTHTRPIVPHETNHTPQLRCHILIKLFTSNIIGSESFIEPRKLFPINMI